jgi:hypothetical protein
MIFNLSNDFDRAKFKVRCNSLYNKGCTVELTEKKKNRTIDQNSLFHLWVKVFAEEVGYVSLSDCKADVKQQLLGKRESENKVTGLTEYRQIDTHTLSVDEMSNFLDKFKIWAQNDFGVYLPYIGDSGFEEMIDYYKNKI